MPNVGPLPNGRVQFFNATGPLVGGFVYTCVAGSPCPGTPLATYTDYTGSVANANPVVLDSLGSASIWLQSGVAYKITVQDSSGVTQWTADGVTTLQTQNSGLIVNALTATSITAASIDGVVNADAQTGSDAGAKLAAAMAVIQAAGGGVVSARGLVGAQTISQDIFSGITVPGVLLLNPNAVFSLTAEQNVPSYWVIDGGVQGFPNSGSQIQAGCILKWTGANSKNVLKVFNAHNVQIRNLNINGNQTTGSTGILYDGTNNPPGHNCVFENLTIKNCAIGIQWGTSAVNDYQVDTTIIRNVQISGTAGFADTASGIVINSGNAGQASVIENCVFQVINKGIDVQEVGGLFSIKRCIAGSLGGTNPVFIGLASVTDIIVEMCQSEGGAAGKSFLSITGSPSVSGSITLINNKLDEPIVVGRSARIVSIGNYGGSTATCSAGTPEVISIGDRFNSQAGWTMTVGTASRFGGGDSGSDLANVIAAQPAGTAMTTPGLFTTQTLSRKRVLNNFSATPAFDASAGDIQQITITGDVTSSTVTNPTDGQVLIFIIIESNGGGHSFAWPTNFKGATTITTTNGITNVQSFIYNSTSTTWYQIPSAA